MEDTWDIFDKGKISIVYTYCLILILMQLIKVFFFHLLIVKMNFCMFSNQSDELSK